MAMLEVKNLHVHYGMIEAIKGIDFEVNKGEVIALIGANGAGKTTTLHTVTGLLPATSGTITFEGKDITNLSIDERAKLGIGFAFQQPIRFKGITVFDLLKLSSEKEIELISKVEGEVRIKQATKKGYIECELPGCADLSYPSSTTRRGRVQDGGQTSPTITATETGVHYIESVYRIRKLTVRECFKLMSFEFEDWDKCAAIGISNSAGYKAAGNSICCCCISLLFEHLYKAQYDESYVCTDEKMQNFQKPEA